MDDCKEYIAEAYTDAQILGLISRCDPIHLQDDLRQEMALIMLQQPCEKIVHLKNEGKLISFVMRVIWIMATSSQDKFYRKYRRSDLAKASNYMYSQTAGKEYGNIADAAFLKLKHKLSQGDIEQHHEALLFNKYIELGNSKEVAEYYNVPYHHVKAIIAKVKKELKQLIRNQ
jgi:hypothetical protein